MFISLLSVFVGHDGPASIDPNLSSLAFEIFTYLDFVFLQLLFISLDLSSFDKPKKLAVLGMQLFKKNNFFFLF